ncbi:MAG TPA: c-type cytochrome [Steroidobacteraceae bacterium]|jgi:cytochrome c oxidase subunit 2|nr:c-type cytochrome [Steroidobacteraceae bacterium]
MIRRFVALTLAALITGAAQAADYEYCTVCHGAEGNGNPAIRAPKIAGIEPWYLKQQFERFRAGMRGAHAEDISGMEMRPVAEPMDDATIEAVAAYVRTFEAKPPEPTVTGDAKRGRKLYAACAPCHGTRGEGNPELHAPALAGQTDWYLVAQLKNFQSGMRGYSPQDTHGAQMRAAVNALPDTKAIENVVAYINTLGSRRPAP